MILQFSQIRFTEALTFINPTFPLTSLLV